MMQERPGAFTLQGRPLTVLGEALSVGDRAPDFRLLATDWREVTLSETDGKIRLISVVPSLDSSVCDAQTRRFNEAATALSDDVVVLTVSADLPYAQRRWCGAAGVENVQTLSDHREMSFGDAYGTHVKELRLEQRAVFVVDRDRMLRYVEYVPEISRQPDYEAVLEAVEAIGQ